MAYGGRLRPSKTATQEQQAELSLPTELPSYRYVYGACWATGTPVGWNVVGDYLYICYLLNSRPSGLDSSHKVLFDNRLVQRSGDPFDFSGAGAAATVWPFDNHVWYWIGRGDQTSCPATIVSESDYFAATDAWQGRTVLWAKLDCGTTDNRSERWPSSPPTLNVEGSWSILTDPRTGQSYAGRNAALVVLDALRNNPLRPYQDDYLWLDSFKEAISRCADLVTNKDGSTTARFVIDHRQGQRLAKIAVLRSRCQRAISAPLMPDALPLVTASRATVDLPAPYATAFNGEYEVESIEPGAGINDDDSVTLRFPAVLREIPDSVYAWDASTEEQDVDGASLSPFVAGVSPPASVTLTSGGDAALISGDTVTPRVQIDFPASVSASAQSYDWQYKIGSGSWQDGGSIDSTAALRAWITPVSVGSSYTVRVRTIGLYGRSGWITSSAMTASGPSETLDTPTLTSATGGSGKITLVGTQGDDGTRVEIWSNSTNSSSTATLITTRNAGPNVSITYANTGLGDGVTRYYWLRARDGYGNASAFSSSKSATTNL